VTSNKPYHMAKSKGSVMIPDELLMNKIYFIRGQKVMLDRDLAELYGVETRRLNEQVKRNILRFPSDFMFQLTKKELENLMSQSATSSWGGIRKLPLAFTEQGVAMLSSVLNSETAIRVNTLCFASLNGWNADFYDFYDGLRYSFQTIQA
jgi:ORF6N domain